MQLNKNRNKTATIIKKPQRTGRNKLRQETVTKAENPCYINGFDEQGATSGNKEKQAVNIW